MNAATTEKQMVGWNARPGETIKIPNTGQFMVFNTFPEFVDVMDKDGQLTRYAYEDLKAAGAYFLTQVVVLRGS